MGFPSLTIRSHRHPKSQTDSGKTVNRFRLPGQHTSHRLRRWRLGGGVDRSDSVRLMAAADHFRSLAHPENRILNDRFQSTADIGRSLLEQAHSPKRLPAVLRKPGLLKSAAQILGVNGSGQVITRMRRPRMKILGGAVNVQRFSATFKY